MPRINKIAERASGKGRKRYVGQELLKDRIERWCMSKRKIIIGLIILVSVLFRAGYFFQINRTYLIDRHLWEQSDMSFFDHWATLIADGNWLSDTVLHPIHKWTNWVADQYFRDHPDVYKSLLEKSGNDTLKNPPSKLLWDQWYGGKQFHQEPLYPYFIAVNYKLFGHDVRIVFLWQMILGIATNLLIYLTARRYFGDFTATLSAVMAVFCGPMFFYELVLLRSAMTVFFGIMLVYLFGIARDKNKPLFWSITGFVTGIAILLQSYYLFFLVGGLVILAIQFRRYFRKYLILSGCIMAGTIIALSPAMIRNAIVGAPLFSLNSNGASTFIADNNVTVTSFTGWNINEKIISDIMSSSDGHLLKAVVPTLKTHGNLPSYLRQLWGKIHATFSWFEIPNNVNFYFFREHSVILSVAFFNFLLLTPLALTGIFIAIIRKKKAAPIYLMILVQLIPLLGFLVLSRHRVALIPVLLPFAAFAVTELTGSWRGWKNISILAGLVILTAWSSSPDNENTVGMMKVDYDSIYNIHYVSPLKKLVDNKEWKKAALLLEDFIDRYEPRPVKSCKPLFMCTRMQEAEVYMFFSWIHSIHAQILVPTGDTKASAAEGQKSLRLKEAGSVNRTTE